VVNKAWTESFDGQLFSIAEQTSLREQSIKNSHEHRSVSMGGGIYFLPPELLSGANPVDTLIGSVGH
jgi:hypothetical protein